MTTNVLKDRLMGLADQVIDVNAMPEYFVEQFQAEIRCDCCQHWRKECQNLQEGNGRCEVLWRDTHARFFCALWEPTGP